MVAEKSNQFSNITHIGEVISEHLTRGFTPQTQWQVHQSQHNSKKCYKTSASAGMVVKFVIVQLHISRATQWASWQWRIVAGKTVATWPDQTNTEWRKYWNTAHGSMWILQNKENEPIRITKTKWYNCISHKNVMFITWNTTGNVWYICTRINIHWSVAFLTICVPHFLLSLSHVSKVINNCIC